MGDRQISGSNSEGQTQKVWVITELDGAEIGKVTLPGPQSSRSQRQASDKSLSIIVSSVPQTSY